MRVGVWGNPSSSILYGRRLQVALGLLMVLEVSSSKVGLSVSGVYAVGAFPIQVSMLGQRICISCVVVN